MNITNVNSIKKVDDVTKDKNKVAIKIIKGSNVLFPRKDASNPSLPL